MRMDSIPRLAGPILGTQPGPTSPAIPWQKSRFVAVGISTVALDYLLLYLLTEFTPLGYFFSAGVSFLLASACNYLLSVRFVFIAGRFPRSFEFSCFLLTSLAGLGLNQVMMWLLVGLAGLNYLLAKTLSIVVVTVWNFLSKKRLVFAG